MNWLLAQLRGERLGLSPRDVEIDVTDVTRRPKKERSKQEGAGSVERILDASEKLFAEHGYKACTFRMISDLSGINQGLLHYHFGTKQNLFCDVFERRAEVLIRERTERLDEAERQSGGEPVSVEALVRSFIEPPLHMLNGDPGLQAFVKIHAQLRSEPLDFSLELRRRIFGASTNRYVQAMRRACPHLSHAAVAWRFNAMIGAYLVVISQGGRLEDLSGGRTASGDVEAAIAHTVAFLVAGFNAPEPAFGNAKPKRGAGAKTASAKHLAG